MCTAAGEKLVREGHAWSEPNRDILEKAGQRRQ